MLSVAWSVLGTPVTCAKMAELQLSQFGGQTCPRNHVLQWGTYWRHLAITTDQFMVVAMWAVAIIIVAAYLSSCLPTNTHRHTLIQQVFYSWACVDVRVHFISVLNRAGSMDAVDTPEAVMSCDDGLMKRGVVSNVTAAGDASSQTSCPVLTDESNDVQQFLTSHAVNGGIVNLLLAYLTELSQRSHLKW